MARNNSRAASGTAAGTVYLADPRDKITYRASLNHDDCHSLGTVPYAFRPAGLLSISIVSRGPVSGSGTRSQ